jgi:hypothetical protein
MKTTAVRTVAVALTLVLTSAAATFAAGPLNGKVYHGGAPTMGVNGEGHTVRTHAAGNVVLRVAASGKSVTVSFNSSVPVLYCATQERIHVQTTKAATISGGSFKATVDERFAAGPGPPSIVQVISGRFSGATVRGTIHTKAAECSGVASFSAKAY